MRTGCRNTNVVVAKNAITLLVQDDANSPKIVLLNINSEDWKAEICYWFTTDYGQRIKRSQEDCRPYD